MPSVVTHRRRLHRIPELDDRLPETCAYVRRVLEPLGCKITAPIPGGLCAFLTREGRRPPPSGRIWTPCR